MQSPFAMIRRWSVTLLCWAALVALAAAVGVRQGPLFAYAEWAGIAALLCVASALLIRSQPMGKATIAGRIGYMVTHYGFRAAQGRLFGAAVISWLVWSVVGIAAIWVVQGDRSLIQVAMAVTWVANTYALMYMWGIALRNRPRVDPGERPSLPSLPRSLRQITAGLLVLTAVSMAVWFAVGTPGARLAAVVMAAAPLVVIGGGYGVMLLVFMTAGRNVRWN